MKLQTDQFKTAALARIKQQEAFLAACGIVPSSGMEQEFYVATPLRMSPDRMAEDSFDAEHAGGDFQHSPFVEKVGQDNKRKPGTPMKPMTPGTYLYEASIGQGNGDRYKERPHASQLPSVMVPATHSLRKIMQANAEKYVGEKGAKIDFDGSMIGVHSSGLQTNMSLWDAATGEPLFRLHPMERGHKIITNALTQCCADAVLEAQQSMPAVVTTSTNALKRAHYLLGTGVEQRTYGIGSEYKGLGHTLLIREHFPEAEKSKASLYFEDCMASASEEPALTMLVTLGGMVQGVKKYMAQNNIATPEAMQEHIASGGMEKPATFQFPVERTRLPDTLSQALLLTRKSELAREIMGDKLHTDFCDAYRKEISADARTSRMAR